VIVCQSIPEKNHKICSSGGLLHIIKLYKFKMKYLVLKHNKTTEQGICNSLHILQGQTLRHLFLPYLPFLELLDWRIGISPYVL
jgi:hypothetical protein